MSKVYTYQEVAEHNTTDSLWIIIEGKVYDATKFIDAHPGGDEIIYDLRGQDATESFNDIGHSDEALKILKTLCIGEVDKNSTPVKVERSETSSSSQKDGVQGNATIVMIAAVIFFVIAYYYTNNRS